MSYIVEYLIEKLGDQVFSALVEETKFALDFRSELDSMKTQIEIMKAFLSDTENLKSKTETLKTTLVKIRDLFYEADNIMTDCLLRDKYRQDGFCAKYSPQELVFKIETGQKLKDINSRLKKAEEILRAYLTPQYPSIQGDVTYQVSGFTSQEFDPSEIIGLENDIEEIKGWISSNDEELHRVGIVGMGGLGKTTIAQKIFNDIEVSIQFEKKIWVSVSQNFNEESIMRSMLEQFGQDSSGSDKGQMLSKIHRVLKDQTCLIVMDDVWSMNLDWWKKLFSAPPKSTDRRSCIIITTRNEEVAASMGVQNSKIHRPKVLNENESWSLFRLFAFSASKGDCPNSEFEKVGRDIVSKCAGLPLAIKTIAALLASKIHSVGEWKKINENFHELTRENYSSITSVTASLQLSYDQLPSHLKLCLLCFSIYPEDFDVRADQLVRWWVGEGLVHDKNTKTATELGFEYLSELVSRCLVDVVQRRGYDGTVYSCKMHDLVRDMTIKVAEDEAFCSFDGKGKQMFTVDSRWLGFSSDMDPKLWKKNSKLRALLLVSSNQVPLNRNLEFLKSLRALDFSYNKLDTVEVEKLWGWISSLKRLGYLNLSGVAGLKEVPSSIQKLRNLQLLVLTECNNLIRVHQSITNLKRLVVLDLGSCRHQFLPRGLERLSNLRELSGFRLASQANTQSCKLLELEKLVQLRVLRINVNSESEISENEYEVLSHLKNLLVFSIDAEDCKDKKIFEMLDRLSPSPRLQELYLRRYRHEVMPEWFNPEQLSTLQYLCIENGDLANIKMNPEFEVGSYSAWNIEGLCLKFLPNLKEDWKNLELNMPQLRYVEVSRCFNLKNFPCSVDKPAVWRKNKY
ncbi:disease resistance RPP13-like protein 4 [Pistacia vera]|uniref:disease resistance RPP13-like protein 4 n=1 Tax=Pistacia vera TaxID=55513 RepID=UPI00126354E6|nr:disease resistance RPP13-like protein 4 [Pistacia vera]